MSDLGDEFRKNLFNESYIFYSFKKEQIKNKKPALIKNKKEYLFSNKIYSKYLKYILLYNLRFVFFFIYFFFNCLRFYAIINTYDYSRRLHYFFKKKKKAFSVLHLYNVFVQLKIDFPYYVSFDLMTCIIKNLRYKFFISNIELLFDIKNFQISSLIDLILIRYISKSYFFYLEHFELTSLAVIDFGFLKLFRGLVDSFFKFVIIPSNTEKFDLSVYLKLFKHHLEISIWTIYQEIYLSSLFRNSSDNLMINQFSNIQQSYHIGTLIFYEILLFYLSKYLLKSLQIIKFSFIFDFFNDFSTKLLLRSGNFFYQSKNDNSILKQYRLFFFDCMYIEYFAKFHKIYEKNYSNFYLEV